MTEQLEQQVRNANRKFSLNGDHLISCDDPCQELFAREVVGSQIKGIKSVTSKRCIASGAALRGQHYNLQTDHNKLTACRACTVYSATEIDKPSTSR